MRFKDKVEADLKNIKKSLLFITQKLETMSKKDEQFKAEVKAEFDRIDASSDEIAKEFKEFADKIEAQGISAVDEQEILTMLRSRADKLEGLGKNTPVDPIPPVDPVEPPVGPVEPPVEPTDPVGPIEPPVDENPA